MNKKSEVLVICLLLVSIVLNIIFGWINYKNNYKAEKQLYNNILNIRTNNETINEILIKAIEAKNIDNLDLLKLYKNYSNINDSIADLWYEYSNYRENRRIFQNIKEIDTESVMINEVHERIEQYFENLLELEMTTQNYKVNVSERVLDNFKNMYDISNQVLKYYNNVFDKELKNINGEERLKKIVNNHYWIDMLKKLNEIDCEYIDYEFSL